MDMNKYQLIQGMINDLGDENNGVQVRGYRNVTIIKSVVEALVNLNTGLKQDEEFVRQAMAEKDETIRKLQAELAELRGETPAPDNVTPIRQIQMARFDGKSWALFGDVLSDK